MPTLQERIQSAREAGFDDPSIARVLEGTPEFSAAQKEGFTLPQIYESLGLNAQIQIQRPPTSGPGAQAVTSTTPFPEIAKVPAIVGAGVGEGLASLAGIPGSIESSVLPSRLTKGVGGGLFPSGGILPTMGDISTSLAPLTRQTAIAPEGPFENILATGSRGAGSGLPFGPAGIAAGATAGLATETARQMGGSGPLDEALGFAAGLPFGLAAQTAGRPATAEASRFAEAGMPLRSAALTSSSPWVQRMLMPSVPREMLEQDLGNSVEGVASRLSPARTQDRAGDILQQEVRDWIAEELPSREAKAWAPLDAKIPPETLTPQTNFEKYVGDLWNSGGENKDLIRQNLPSIIQRYNEILQTRGPTGMAPIEANIGWPSVIAKTPSWQNVKDLRSSIGDMKRRPSVLSSIGSDTIDGMYQALSDDLRSTAQRAGALQDFNDATATSNALRQFKDRVLSRFTTSDTGNTESVTPKTAADRLDSLAESGDLTTLKMLRQEIPRGTDAVAAQWLRQKSLAKPEDSGSSINKGYSNEIAKLERYGTLDDFVGDPDLLRSIRASSDIHSTLTPAVKASRFPSTRAAMAGGAGAGGAVGGLGALALGYGSEPAILSAIIGSDLGMMGGGLPLLYRGGRDLLGTSTLAARYAGVEKPPFLGAALPAILGAIGR